MKRATILSLSTSWMRSLFSCAALIVANSAAAQPDSLWSRTFGGSDWDVCNSLQQTTDGGYILGGATYTFGAGGYDFWIVKTDTNGDSLWSRTYGGEENDVCYSIQQTTDGGYVMAGYSRSFRGGWSDFWLIKTDSNGDSLWSRSYLIGVSCRCQSVQQTSDGGYILGGYIQLFVNSPLDYWVVRTDANGDSLWTRRYGGAESDFLYSVRETADDGYILAGRTRSFGSELNECWIIKTNASGDSLWSRTYGRSDGAVCRSVQQTADGGYILGGTIGLTIDSENDFWVLKVDVNGDSLWSGRFGGNDSDECYSVEQSSDGGFVLAGITHSYGPEPSATWMLKTDAHGDSLWSITIGGGYCYSMQQAVDGGYVIAGDTWWNNGAGYTDMWLVKTGPEPALVAEFNHVPFESIVIEEDLTGVVDIAVGDIDADGEMDVAAVDMFADQVVAYENIGNREFLPHIIEDGLDGACAIDIGFLAGNYGRSIAACGRFESGVRTYAHDWNGWNFEPHVYQGDTLGKYDIKIYEDSPTQLITTSVNGKVIRWEGVDTLTLEPFDISLDSYNVDHFRLANFDVDFYRDVVGSSRESGIVYWWEGTAGGSFIEHEIIDGVHLNSFCVADLDNDLDQDILCATITGGILWFENDGNENFIEHVIVSGMEYPFDIEAADINLDGFMDFVLADSWQDEISWWRNIGNGEFRRNIITDMFTQARAIEVVDFDGDGDIDIIGAGQNGIMLWQNNLIISDDPAPGSSKFARSGEDSPNVSLETQSKGDQLPTEFLLHANYPNPFNASTTIAFELPRNESVSLKVYDVLGRKVSQLLNETMNAGSHSVIWDCANCATGVYLIELKGDGFREVKKAMLLR